MFASFSIPAPVSSSPGMPLNMTAICNDRDLQRVQRCTRVLKYIALGISDPSFPAIYTDSYTKRLRSRPSRSRMKPVAVVDLVAGPIMPHDGPRLEIQPGVNVKLP